MPNRSRVCFEFDDAYRRAETAQVALSLREVRRHRGQTMFKVGEACICRIANIGQVQQLRAGSKQGIVSDDRVCQS
jgi:hypothetical protein